MSRTSTPGRVLLPAALPAIMSGFTVALAISTGELAPLLFTAGFTDQNPSLKLFHPADPLPDKRHIHRPLSARQASHATAAAAGMLSLVILILLITHCPGDRSVLPPEDGPDDHLGPRKPSNDSPTQPK